VSAFLACLPHDEIPREHLVVVFDSGDTDQIRVHTLSGYKRFFPHVKLLPVTVTPEQFERYEKRMKVQDAKAFK